jgi:hypothetical protein
VAPGPCLAGPGRPTLLASLLTAASGDEGDAVDEREWLNATEPQAMLGFLRDSGRLSERKARLFSAAVCRRIWSLLTDERSRDAVGVVERAADGSATREDFEAARVAADGALSAAADASYFGESQDNFCGSPWYHTKLR